MVFQAVYKPEQLVNYSEFANNVLGILDSWSDVVVEFWNNRRIERCKVGNRFFEIGAHPASAARNLRSGTLTKNDKITICGNYLNETTV